MGVFAVPDWAEITAADSALEPIAIVGMSCRLPGGIHSPSDLWRFLFAGDNAAGNVPPDRWEPYVRSASDAAVIQGLPPANFIDDPAAFDADFFGISPREAELMDPQQRIVLETAWEALEDAGIRPSDLAGSDAGVYIGAGSDDYGRRMLEDTTGIEAWTGIGSSLCGIANRVSYCFDLRGASLTVDTACSSSLVAVHIACQALRSREVPLALVGGVNIIAGPGLSVVLDRAGATSPDGRSKSFDDGADGYGRGEGAAVVVLKRLADAKRDGDRVLALIRGSGVYQDGRTNGIMAPSSAAQTNLLRKTYSSCGIDPATVDFVEAHGTGTPTGDPVEVQAMAAVFGIGRDSRNPCLVGSVKSSIGHLEAGAGAVGLIKTVLALRHGQIPRQANFSAPNSTIDWSRTGLRVVDRAIAWPCSRSPRRAGVSSYGYGGTLGHVIVEEHRQADATGSPRQGGNSGCVIPISAKSEEALTMSANRLADALADAATLPAVEDVSHTLGTHREHYAFRAGIAADGTSDLIHSLRRLADGNPDERTHLGRHTATDTAGCVWVFSGHGSQWSGMGVELLDQSPEFAAVIDRLESPFLEEIGLSPRDALHEGVFDEAHITQPMIYAIQVALAHAWRAQGLEPAAVVGHSVGEIAAAVTAGVLDIDAGARLVCRRSSLLKRVAGMGAMAMVDSDVDTVTTLLPSDGVAVPAIHAAPHSTVVAGDVAVIDRLCAELARAGIESRRVASNVAFHSPHMDPLLDELRSAASDLPVKPASVRLYTTALEDARAHVARDADYWAANLRNPVRFTQAVAAAASDGHRAFLEISPHPIVAHSITETLTANDVTEAIVAHTMRRHRPQLSTLLANKAFLYAHGTEIEWSKVGGRFIDLPTTSWRHRRYWYAGQPTTAQGPLHNPSSHSLLAASVDVHAIPGVSTWHTTVDYRTRPYPGSHPIGGVEIVPAAVIVNTLLSARAVSAPTDRTGLRGVEFRSPLALNGPREIQVVVENDRVSLASRSSKRAETETWGVHATAELFDASSHAFERLDLERIRQRCAVELSADHIVNHLESVGVADTGFEWRVTSVRRNETETIALVDVGAERPFAPLIDAATSIATIVLSNNDRLKMVARVEAIVTLADRLPASAAVHVRIRDGLSDVVDVTIARDDGEPFAHIGGLCYRDPERPSDAPADVGHLIHATAWHPLPLPKKPRRGRRAPKRLIVLGDPALAAALADVTDTVTTTIVAGPDQLTGTTIDNRTAVLIAPPRTNTDESSNSAASQAAWLLSETIQRLAGSGSGARVWAVTRGAREAETLESLSDSTLWGVGRVLANEHPELWGGIVDLEATPTSTSLSRLVEIVTVQPHEDVVAARGDDLAVARLVPVAPPSATTGVHCRKDASYLITGGLGALGLIVASWLVDRGARSIVLLSRSGLGSADASDAVDPEGIQRQLDAIETMRSRGASVTIVAADVGDAPTLHASLRQATADLPPIRGVVHAAGVLDNRAALDINHASLTTVMHPKVSGARLLHELFPPGTVDFFVLFSSCGPLLGLHGQTAYAAANAYLDGLARHRHHSGVTDTISFQWTSWRGLGMSTSSAVIDAELAARGTGDISVDEALRCWDLACTSQQAELAILRTIDSDHTAMRLPLLSELTAVHGSNGEITPHEWLDNHGSADLDRVESEVRRHIAHETRIPAEEITGSRSLTEMGLDSVMTLAIRRALERTFHLRLPASMLWERPTTSGIALYIADQLTSAATTDDAGTQL